MSETFQISAGERGVIRLFTISLTRAQAAGLLGKTPDDALLTVIADALGVHTLDPQYVEVFATSDLEGLGLAGYLTEGLGVDEADVAPDRMRLNGLGGHVAIVLSRAFDVAAQITPGAPLRWIGTYTEGGASIRFAPLPADSAKGTTDTAPAKPAKSDARVGGMIAMYALLAMFAFVGLLIWVAG